MSDAYQYLYSNNNNDKSENYRKLESLCQDVKNSWHYDRDETNSMKEIIEIINGMLIMSSLEDYFSNNKTDLDYFMGEFSNTVITYILYQPVVYGDNGDDIALDLLFHFVKLFMTFHKKKEYSQLFENIRKIFASESTHSFFLSQNRMYKKEINPNKGNTYEQYNEEFCKNFKKDKKSSELFKIGDKVDIRIRTSGRLSMENNSWVRGTIKEMDDNEYTIEYPSKNTYDNKTTFPFDDPNVLKEGIKTDDWEWRLSLKENDVVDCYDRGKWYPATVYKVVETKNSDNDFVFKEYTIGFRLYPENFLENGKYDYNTFLQYTNFWDNSGDAVDREGRNYYGDGENADETLPFYSKRIQKFQTFSLIQRESINNQINKLYSNINNSPTFGVQNNAVINISNNIDGEERIKMMTKLLENDKIEKNIDDLYYYEKDNQINYIIGKDTENFSYYFAKFLKILGDNGYFEEMINILKDHPIAEEINNIFFILMNCTSYIHKEFFRQNYQIFKNAFFDMMDTLSSKEMKTLQKEVTELAKSFFIKINYTLSENKALKSEDMNEINIILSLKMIKSSIFDKKIQGLKDIGDYIKTISDEEGKLNLIKLIKQYDIIKNIFGTNYHTQIISKSKDILELMIKNNELTEEDLKLIWSLTKQGDLEATKIIIKLLNDLVSFLNENYCNIILDFCSKEDKQILNEDKIDLIYNLAIKGNNIQFMTKCCELYCNNALEYKNKKNLSTNPYISKVLNLISKGDKFGQIVFDICENNLKNNNNILSVFILLEKIIEKYRNNIKINAENNNNNEIHEMTITDNNDSDYINKLIQKLIDHNKLLNLFSDNFLLYKKRAKESIKENEKENNLIIDGYTHEENMKNRIIFLIKIIPILYPKFDFFKLSKEICIDDPVFPSDKNYFYDFMKKYISENDSNAENNIISKEQKIAIETQLFNMLTDENKSKMTISQYNLYIEIFLDINSTKDILVFNKNPIGDYLITINNTINIDEIYGIDKLWELLFELKNEEIIQKLINFIYNIYQNKKEIKNLLDKCVDFIKDIENINYNKLEKCINIIKFIILDSEKDGYIQIKSHFGLLKDCILNIPLDLKPNKKVFNNPHNFSFNLNKVMNKEKNSIDLLFGNTTIMELRQILADKFNIEEKNIYINFNEKENNNSANHISNNNNNSQNSKILGSSYNNKSLKEVLNIDIDNYDDGDICGRQNKDKDINCANKFTFNGDKVEKEPFFKFNKINPKFKAMIKEWFNQFSNGSEILEKDSILKFISCLTGQENIDEKDKNYILFMRLCDKDQKEFIFENEFVDYYEDLCQTDSEKIREHMKIMKYRDDFQKSNNNSETEIINKNNLPRYILGNDKQFYNSLVKIFDKFEKKMPIYEFLFFLCTNEEKYNQLLDNFEILFNEENNNINYLEELYQLKIIESFLQDLEINQLDLKKLFPPKTKRKTDDNDSRCKIMAKDYLPFDSESNLNKKKSFFMNFIENKGYEKLIRNIEIILDSIENNNSDEEEIKFKCCKTGLKIINIIYNSLIEKNNIIENKNKIDVYFLNKKINIPQNTTTNNTANNKEKEDAKEIVNEIIEKKEDTNTINIDNENENERDIELNKLKNIILNTEYSNLIKKIISFLIKSQYSCNQILCNYCFNILVNLITNNELLLFGLNKNDDIKKIFSTLIKNNINSPTNTGKFFIQSLIKFINNLSTNKKSQNKLDYEFLFFIFEISNNLFIELMNSKNENSNNNPSTGTNSFSLFFDFFSSLIKVVLGNDINGQINKNINSEFIFQIYDLLYKDLKEKNKDKKLEEDTFLGFIKILITVIKSNQLIKNQIVTKKINDDETLFDLIYNKILNIKKNIKENERYSHIINSDNIQLEYSIMQLKDSCSNINDKFLQMETINEFIKNYKSTHINNDEGQITQKIYDIYNEFILICLSNTTDPDNITKLLKIKPFKEDQNNLKQKKNKIKISKSYDHVGLKNNGCICYMNSILQQMYMVPSFRYAIMSSDDNKDKNMQTSFFSNNRYDDNLLHQLQRMYTFLTYSEKQAYNPKDFCESFKDLDNAPINPHVQQDSQEFFNNFCDKIENCLKNTKYKYIIDNIFTGKTCSSVICDECKTISNRFEDFYNLTLEVKNISSLYESLQRLISPEKIDNFKCEKCEKNVTISKRTSLAKLPNVLFVHLKRFNMNYETGQTEKINSKFEFPNTLDLKQFCIEEITKNTSATNETNEIYPKEDEYYQYELKGINIHIGNAQGGHYTSFIDVERDGHNNDLDIKTSIENNIIKSKWLKFNDAIVSEFDTKEIPQESYGGYTDNNLNNENIKNAYLLIYERKKKIPIKIVGDKDIDKNIDNENIIKFKNEQKSYIDKFYDISYLNKEKKINEKELYNLIFMNEETNECYSYTPYYNIEKNVLKENIIEVMNKNNKFLSNKIFLEEKPKFKDECNDVLLGCIHLKDFNIINNNFSINEKRQLIQFFQEEILENKIFKNDNLVEDEEQKVIINDRTTILLEKIIIPIIVQKKEDINEEYDDLVEYIGNILLTNDNFEKIFETRNRIFDIKNIKIMSDTIYTLITFFNENLNIQKYFKKIYKLIENSTEDNSPYVLNGNDISENSDNKKENESAVFYLYDLILKLIKLNKNVIDGILTDSPIIPLLGKINSTKSYETRKIIYEIITYMLDKCYDNTGKQNYRVYVDSDDKEKIQNKIYKSKKLVKRLFKEKIDILCKLIKISQLNSTQYSEKFNKYTMEFLFNHALKEKKVNQMMDLLYEIININDNFILDRLYFIMGYPEFIMKHEIKEEKEEQDFDDYSDSDEDDNNFSEYKKEKKREKKEKEEKLKEINKNKNFWPVFGNRLLKESANGEIFKYVNNLKVYETHCILAQLFPCSNKDVYANSDFIENDENLDEKDRNLYIYKLLCLCLLEEGNYCLFKYIYLMPSRFILKYSNLYEEIIDILTKENKYDLTEILNNAEICIKRIKYETRRINDNICLLSNKKIEDIDEDYNENKNDDENNQNNRYTPDLPDKMRKNYKENDNIDEFMGFIPQHLPDKIKFVEYKQVGTRPYMKLISIKYYTTFVSINSIKKKEKEKVKQKEEEKKIEMEKEIEKDNNINIIINEGDTQMNETEANEEKEKEKEKGKVNFTNIGHIKNDSDSDDELLNKNFKESHDDNIYNVNDIKMSENLFLKKILHKLKYNKKVILYDDLFNSKEKVKLSYYRYILTSNFPNTIILKVKLSNKNYSTLPKNNYYIPKYSIGCVHSNKYSDVISIIRKNKNIKFIDDDSLGISINIKGKEMINEDKYFDEFSDHDSN